MYKKRMKCFVLVVLMLFSLSTIFNPFIVQGSPLIASRTYTLDADFDEGVLAGVEHDTVSDQLQLSKTPFTLPFIWVPNQQGTVSKINTETGKELARYWVAPFGNTAPSRTTVDLEGNCYVGVRQAGTVVKIGLFENDQWIDRNGDGICQTSQDSNDDGIISGAELLPWGQDECVLYELVLVPGYEGAYAPGTYTGPYDTNYWGVAPRGLAIDDQNNLWVGTWSTKNYYYIAGVDGTILRTIDVAPYGHSAYGAVIDKNGILWSSAGSGLRHVLRIDPSTEPASITRININIGTYGIGLDYLDHLFVSGWTTSALARLDIITGGIQWIKAGPYTARGVACTADNDVWIAATNMGRVYRYTNDGVLKAQIPVGNGPTGVAVDAAGKVWVCNLNDENVVRIDPATNTVDLTKQIVGSGGHYSYSDMTGIVSRTLTTKIGTWNVIFDSEEANIPWGTVSWNSYVPVDTAISVKVRSSEDMLTWSTWEPVTNGIPTSATPNGRYLQIETKFQIFDGEASPILYDLSVHVGNRPPIAHAGADQVLEQTNHSGAEVVLDGSLSSDPDGDPLTYLWAWDGGTASGEYATVIFPLGTTEVNLTVFDGLFEDTDSVLITVVDTTPPDIIMLEDPIILWPPNHKYHMISLDVIVLNVTDNCDADVGMEDVILTNVTSDEPEDVKRGGDGRTYDDILILNNRTVCLRAERQGRGNGRVYTINVQVTDKSNNTGYGSFKVWVPHCHCRCKWVAIDDDPAYTVVYDPEQPDLPPCCYYCYYKYWHKHHCKYYYKCWFKYSYKYHYKHGFIKKIRK